MHIDTAGTYTLQYTATDSCGNETIEERTVEVVSLMTTLFTDGTFIINEKSTDRDANIALHGAVTNEYIPCNPSGTSAASRYNFSSDSTRPWHAQRASVRTVEIGSKLKPNHTAFWFSGFTACTSMDLANLDTSGVTTMENMLYDCRVLPTLDIAHFDTSHVSTMNRMFRNCYVLASLDVANFNTSNVITMRGMFDGCKALTSLDLTSFNTSKVTDMQYMFNDCNALATLDVSSFDTSKVTDMTRMFCNCYVLTPLDVTNFNTSKVTNMTAMFRNCYVLTSLDLSSFNTSAVTDMTNMFNTCRLLETIYVSTNFVVSQVTSSATMFATTSALVGGAGTAYAASNPKDKTYAHIDGGTADPGYFTAKP